MGFGRSAMTDAELFAKQVSGELSRRRTAGVASGVRGLRLKRKVMGAGIVGGGMYGSYMIGQSSGANGGLRGAQGRTPNGIYGA